MDHQVGGNFQTFFEPFIGYIIEKLLENSFILCTFLISSLIFWGRRCFLNHSIFHNKYHFRFGFLMEPSDEHYLLNIKILKIVVGEFWVYSGGARVDPWKEDNFQTYSKLLI